MESMTSVKPKHLILYHTDKIEDNGGLWLNQYTLDKEHPKYQRRDRELPKSIIKLLNGEQYQIRSASMHMTVDTDSMHQFEAAAFFYREEYKTNYPSDKSAATFVKNAGDLLSVLNNQEEGTINSLDVVSHGGTVGLWFSHIWYVATADYIPNGEPRQLWRVQKSNLYVGQYIMENDRGLDDDYNKNKIINGTPSGTNDTQNLLIDNSNSHFIEEINAKIFMDSCRVEFHGCETGGLVPYDREVMLNQDMNMAKQLSLLLYNKGIRYGFVIGHLQPSSTALKKDFRLGKRIVYWRGNILAIIHNDNIATDYGTNAKVISNMSGEIKIETLKQWAHEK